LRNCQEENKRKNRRRRFLPHLNEGVSAPKNDEQYQAQPSSHHTHQHEEYEIASPEFYRAIEAALPPVFTRQTASHVMGGLISAKTLSNLDALGQGPPVKAKIGHKVAYERESFMRWLRQRLR
jgi:hypothetical protein